MPGAFMGGFMDGERVIRDMQHVRPLLFPEFPGISDFIYFFSTATKTGSGESGAALVRRVLDDFAVTANSGRRLS